MHQRLQESLSKRRSRVSATGPLTAPDPQRLAWLLDEHVRNEAWMLVSRHLGDVMDADALLAVKDALWRIGRPFGSLFPDGEPEVHAALVRVLARSGGEQRTRFTSSLSCHELESLGPYIR